MKRRLHGNRWRSRLAHRIAFEHWIGPLNGLHCCHSCDTPGCVNPDHLFPGTDATNLSDMKAKGRSNRGARNGSAVLTLKIVREIRRRHALGESQVSLARWSGVSQSQVSRVIHGKRWSHVG